MVFPHHRPNMKFSGVHLAFKKIPFSLKNTHPHIHTSHLRAIRKVYPHKPENRTKYWHKVMAAAQRENVPAQNEARQMEERNSPEETREWRGGEVGGVKDRRAPRASSQFLPLLICLSNCAITGLIFQNPPWNVGLQSHQANRLASADKFCLTVSGDQIDRSKEATKKSPLRVGECL